MNTHKNKLGLIIWLSIVCFLVYAMVFVGGMTRLTDSGLSMVEWRPLMGVLPPLNEGDWMSVFNKYKLYPEYKIINTNMSLSEFKYIFYWEYFHRLLGRLVGLVFLIPMLIMQFKGTLKAHGLTKKLWVGFSLGALQGLMGWYMVKSGLINNPDVSHYRLAAHFMLALVIFSYLFWIILDLLDLKKQPHKFWFKFTLIILALVTLQLTYGAFTAGLKAGFGYNTFPLMGDQWVPNGLGMFNSFWINIFENKITVQFIHRTLGWSLFFTSAFLYYKATTGAFNSRQTKTSYILFVCILLQFSLGVLTLIYFVPLTLAIAHQTGAVVVLMASLYSAHSFK